jgi:hypothetical protein
MPGTVGKTVGGGVGVPGGGVGVPVVGVGVPGGGVGVPVVGVGVGTVGGAVVTAHSSIASWLPLPTAVLSRTTFLVVTLYHAQPRGYVGSATVPSTS